jgi:hypothetical protein
MYRFSPSPCGEDDHLALFKSPEEVHVAKCTVQTHLLYYGACDSVRGTKTTKSNRSGSPHWPVLLLEHHQNVLGAGEIAKTKQKLSHNRWLEEAGG